MIIICPRCKKEKLKYAFNLCVSCYSHKKQHIVGKCYSCLRHNFNYEDVYDFERNTFRSKGHK